MNTIKQFFEHINLRLTNPFFFSFTVSWLLCNWKVPVALAFYNHHELLHLGYSNYIEFISAVVNCWSGMVFPIIGGLAYTVGSPQLNRLINWYQTDVGKKTEEEQLRILQGSSIPIDKYMTLRESIVAKEEILEKLIRKESETVTELNERNTEVVRLKAETNNKQKRLDDIELKLKTTQESYNKISEEYRQVGGLYTEPESLRTFFTDAWCCEYQFFEKTSNNQFVYGIEDFIIDNHFYMVNGKPAFSIDNIKFSREKFLQFTKIRFKNQSEKIYVNLLLVDEGYWIGYETAGNFRYALVRYYPAYKKPDDILYMANSSTVNTLNTTASQFYAYMKAFKPKED